MFWCLARLLEERFAIATLTVSVDPVPLATEVTFAGCGYRADEHLWLGLGYHGRGLHVFTDPTGCFSQAWTFPTSDPTGPTTVSTWDDSNGRVKQNALASVTFTVVS